MTVEATSPDGQIIARIRGQAEDVAVTFRRGAYRRYRERVLADQLGKLASLVFVRYRRYEQEIVEATLPHLLVDDGADFGPERPRYLAAIKQIVATGATDDGQIQLSARGLVSWDVTIADGVLDRRSEEDFVTALGTAVRHLLDDYRTQVFRLKDEIYDLGYSDTLRRAVGLGLRDTGRGRR